MRRSVLALLSAFSILAAAQAGADTPQASAAPQPPQPPSADSVLGMQLKAAVDTFGLPQSMFTYRGSDPTRDDVVFFYPGSHMYLFWYKDRVWQVRFDQRATVTVHGISLGMSRAAVEAAVPERPLVQDGNSLYVDLDVASFPVRMRVVFSADAVSDIYVYRSDF